MIELVETWVDGHLQAVAIEGEEGDKFCIGEQLYAQMMGWA